MQTALFMALTLSLFLFVPVAYALSDITEYFPPAKIFFDITSIINTILPNLVLVAGIILFLLVIVAGFQMITAAGSGDAQKTDKWKNVLKYGIAGFVIVLLSYTVIVILEAITGIKILSPDEVFRGD